MAIASSRVAAGLVVALALTSCKPENKLVAPPPPEISVAQPLKQAVTPYAELTGNTQAFATVDLVARVQGFLVSIDYKDGALVKKGDVLFQIEPVSYEAQVKQAEAQLESAKAQLVKAQAEFVRQETLLRQNVSAQVSYDQAKASRDSAAATVENNEASLVIAKTNLGYTKVLAPFDGIVTRHLVSVGELVGNGVATKLATIVQLDPIYATFTLSEQEVLSIRANIGDRRLTLEELSRVPMEIGLMNEQGFPHAGNLNYVSPELDSTTGTIQVRGLFQNASGALLPGFFVRARIPTGAPDQQALLVPNRVLAEDQAGKYLLVVNKDDVVEQKHVTTGQATVGGMRVIMSGLSPDDRVVLSTSGRAIPGNKVVPKPTKIEPPPAASTPSK
ncbi:MAG: efflux RND transporter periplasmic adaptor subunit [Enhydrobacter sp.]|nr:MAG: efflux RND transporter periplasmic adaptor subunit [Enhydrobacter sp.]